MKSIANKNKNRERKIAHTILTGTFSHKSLSIDNNVNFPTMSIDQTIVYGKYSMQSSHLRESF